MTGLVRVRDVDRGARRRLAVTDDDQHDTRIHIWIVEDNAFLRDTLVEVLDRQPWGRCTLAVETCEEALEALDRGEVPQVVLMDLGLPGMDGLEGISRIKTASPASHVIVVTVQEDRDQIFEALCAGASGYLLKPASASEVAEAIQTALDGGAPINAFIARKVLSMFTEYAAPRRDYGLTEREREILELLTEGCSQKRIAIALELSRHTVDTHLRNIYGKLHVHSRTAAVAKALKERLL